MEQVGTQVEVQVTDVAAPPLRRADKESKDRLASENQPTLLEPAASIIKLFGGYRAVAKICGVHHSRVCRWQRPPEVGGTGGLVPQRHHPALIKHAEEMGVKFDPLLLIRMPTDSRVARYARYSLPAPFARSSTLRTNMET